MKIVYIQAERGGGWEREYLKNKVGVLCKSVW